MAYTLDWKTPLYNGSVKIYSIQCYINKTKNLLYEYLEKIKTLQNENISEEGEEIVKNAIISYEKYMPKTTLSNPWTKQVVMLYIIENMFKLNNIFIVSNLTEKYLKDLWNIIYKESYIDLVNFMKKIEGLNPSSTSDNIILEKEFNVEFFSVMRLPVQFFADRTIAYRYTKGNEAYLYKYERNVDLKLLNISDENILYEMVESSMPFNSFETYDEKTVLYYTEMNINSLRRTIVFPMIENSINEIKKESNKLLDDTEKLKIYNWNLNHRLNTSYDDPEYLNILRSAAKSNKWGDIINYIISDLRKNQPEIWNKLLEQNDIKVETPDKISEVEKELYNIILTKFPSENIYFEDFEDYFNIIYRSEHKKTVEAIRDKYTNVLSEWIDNLNICFKLKDNLIKNELIKKIIGTYNKDMMIRNLFEEWKNYFTFDIISPRGLWIVNNWLRSTISHKEPRVSYYATDTLLIYTLINSTYYIKNQYQGWYCENTYEIMIHNPSNYGNLVRVDIPFNHNDPNCSYIYD